MALPIHAIEIFSRPLPSSKIKTRPGKGGQGFSYISADVAIRLLNEAFGGEWSFKIVTQERVGETAIVLGELSAPGENGIVVKQQFGSCDITRGLAVGDAYKGAASDALKKAATLLGLALELYEDEPYEQASEFSPPKAAVSSALPGGASPPKVAVRVAPPLPAPPQVKTNGGNGNSSPLLNVPKPRPAVVETNGAKGNGANPWTEGQNSGPSTTQMQALRNIAARKGLSETELIHNSGVSEIGNFEDLTYSQAIDVIRRAQQG